jgi:hypothetical protein
VPPLIGVAVNVTLVPEQILFAVLDIETEGVTLAVTLKVTIFEVAELVV